MEENMVIAPNEEIGVEELEENLTGEVEQQQAEENDELVAALRQGLGEFPDIQINSPADALPEVLNFSTLCINSQTFINYLNTRAVFVSGGSACDKGEPSHTLQAMGCDDLTIRTALRVSFCADNTPEDVQALLDGLRDGLHELQHI